MSASSKGPPANDACGVSKWYGAYQALKNVDLQVGLGQRVVICGPSGFGKSTHIRWVNRIETHAQGSI